MNRLRLPKVVLVEVAREELPALLGDPPNDGSTSIFGVQELSISEVVKSWEGPLTGEPYLICYLSSKQDGVLGLHEDSKDLAIVHRFLPSSRHQSRVCSGGTYYQVFNIFLLETVFYSAVSFILTTKWLHFRPGRYERHSRTRRSPVGPHRKRSGPRCWWQRVRVRPRNQGTRPVKHDIPRGLETPGTRDESTTITGACEKCGREVAGISASTPGRRTLEPCGHETGFLTAKQRMLRDSTTTIETDSLRTDGRGAPLTREKPQRQADRANSHFCEAIGSRVYCLKPECGHCGNEDGESR